MKVARVEIPETVVTAAAVWMQGAKPFTAGDLTKELQRLLIRAGIKLGNGEVAMRLADRLIQKHKKAGDIVLSGTVGSRSRWSWS